MSPRLFIQLGNLSSSEETIQGESTAAIMWLVILLLMVLLGGIAALAIRRHFRGSGDIAITSTFDLGTLRKMRDRGELTDEEFKKACDHLHRDVLPTEKSDPPIS